MAKPESNYTEEVKSLVGAYGEADTAKLLNVTTRALQYWVAGSGSKSPREATRLKIHELFIKHQAGDNLKNLLNGQHAHDYRDDIIALLKEKSNSEARKTLQYLEVNNALLKATVQVLAKIQASLDKRKLKDVQIEMNNLIEQHLQALRKDGT